MAAELRYKRVVVDSRFRVPGGTSSDFAFDLPESLYLPPGTYAYLDGVIIPMAWWTVELGLNDKVKFTQQVGGTVHTYTATIPPGVYDSPQLGNALVTAMNLVNPVNPVSQSAAYDPAQNKLSISSLGLWEFVADGPSNADHILNFGKNSNSVVECHPDIRHVHQVLIEADLGQVECLTPRGAFAIVKRVPINMLYGQVQSFDGYHPIDRMPVGGQIISRLNIRLLAVDGSVIPLHGSNVSFSILFE